jgi:hypothetical protein
LILEPSWMVGDDIEVLREIRLLNRDSLFKIYEF